jgi:tetratricopeptide (TPR) repeat protein
MLSQLKELIRRLLGIHLVSYVRSLRHGIGRDSGFFSSEASFLWGVVALQLGRTAEASRALHRALNAKPPNPKAALKLAELALVDGDEVAAFELYGRALEIAPDFAEAYLGRGKAAARLGLEVEAHQSFRRAFDINPKFPEAGLRLAEWTLGNGSAAEALELYRGVLRVCPELAEAHLGCGKAAARLGFQAEALEAFRQAFEINPDYLEARLRLAEWTLANGYAAEALEIYRTISKTAPDLAEAAYGSGVAALEVGCVEEARNCFGRALKLHPEYAAAITAAAFLEIFPADRELKPAKSQRPLICVPVLPYLRGWLGGQIYLLNFARIMATLPKSQRPRLVVVVMDVSQKDPGLRELVTALCRCDSVIGVFDQVGQLVFQRPLLDRYLRTNHRTDRDQSPQRKFFANVDWTFPVLYPSWGIATVPHPIFWIPDFQHRFWPKYFKAEELVARDRDTIALAKRSLPIVFSSRDAESHFHRFYPERHCRSHVWHFHAAPDPVPLIGDPRAYAALDLPQRFYYTPNQFWPHKNHATLFRALRRLLDDGHDVTFVCTGSDLGLEPDPHQRSLLSLIAELNLGRNLRLLGVLPRALQFELFRRACAIIQPSLFEGWSTVIEDARAIGRPLIVSDIPLHREQVDGGAIFFSAQDHISLAAAISEADSRLAPGPDIERENASREALRGSIMDSARAFLDILGSERRSS